MGDGATPERGLPIQRSNLHDETVRRLRGMILDGTLAPGGRIPEARLCEMLGISRTPLREALKVLASEDLVELRPNRGAIVATIDPAEIQAMFEVLEGLEKMVGALAGIRAGEGELRALDALVAELSVAYGAGAPESCFRIGQEIHLLLARATHNPVLVSIYEGLSARIGRACALLLRDTSRQMDSLSEHEAINAALQLRDGARLGLLLRQHARATGDAVLRALKAATLPAGANNPAAGSRRSARQPAV